MEVAEEALGNNCYVMTRDLENYTTYGNCDNNSRCAVRKAKNADRVSFIAVRDS
jgi:hypothetical protein